MQKLSFSFGETNEFGEIYFDSDLSIYHLKSTEKTNLTALFEAKNDFKMIFKIKFISQFLQI